MSSAARCLAPTVPPGALRVSDVALDRRRHPTPPLPKIRGTIRKHVTPPLELPSRVHMSAAACSFSSAGLVPTVARPARSWWRRLLLAVGL